MTGGKRSGGNPYNTGKTITFGGDKNIARRVGMRNIKSTNNEMQLAVGNSMFYSPHELLAKELQRIFDSSQKSGPVKSIDPATVSVPSTTPLEIRRAILRKKLNRLRCHGGGFAGWYWQSTKRQFSERAVDFMLAAIKRYEDAGKQALADRRCKDDETSEG